MPTEPTPGSLELRHLRAFVAVAEELNFSRAAARLFVSQSSLSRQIGALERLLGCVLVRRSTHEVTLTLAGQVLLEGAPDVLRNVDQLVSETRSIGGELAARIHKLGEPFADLTYADVEELRAAAERHYALLPLLPDVEYVAVNTLGVPGLLARGEGTNALRLLLLHGGTYTSGSSYGFRSLAGALVDATGGAVLTPDYRLAPEHVFPAAVEDAEAAYRWLLAQGTAPRDVVFVGDTSGAQHAFSVLLRLKERGEPLPGRCVLFTPFVDTRHAVRSEPAQCGTRAGAGYGMASYLDGHPADDPVVAPLCADLGGMPPTLIQAAAGDEGLPDAERLAAHARSCGVDVRLNVYPVAAQSFQLYWSFLPEGAEAVREVGTFCAS